MTRMIADKERRSSFGISLDCPSVVSVKISGKPCFLYRPKNSPVESAIIRANPR
jgi:hypothetical protein